MGSGEHTGGILAKVATICFSRALWTWGNSLRHCRKNLSSSVTAPSSWSVSSLVVGGVVTWWWGCGFMVVVGVVSWLWLDTSSKIAVSKRNLSQESHPLPFEIQHCRLST